MDKTNRLLRMMEHPDRYTEEQLQKLLCDEECRKLYETMRLTVSAFEAENAKRQIADGIKDEEWQKFEKKKRMRSIRFQKIAAAFIGVLLLSVVSYATVLLIRPKQQPVSDTSASTAEAPQAMLQVSLSEDTTLQARIFENMPLDEMVSEIARHYHKVAEIQSDEAHGLRLYYKWEPQDKLESVVEDLNHFDHVNLAVEGDRLIVKPSNRD